MTVTTNKQIGLVASLLAVLSLVYALFSAAQSGYSLAGASPFGFTIGLFLLPLGFIGFILFLIAMYGFSKDYQDNAIFNYVLYGFILGIVFAVIVTVIAAFFLVSSIGNLVLTPTGPNPGPQFLQDFLENFLPLFLVAPIVGLIPALFNMLAFNRLANKSGVRLFRVVGLLGVIAAIVGIAFWVLGVALYYAGTLSIYNIFTLSVASSIVSLIAWIMAINAYYSIQVPTSQASSLPGLPEASSARQS